MLAVGSNSRTFRKAHSLKGYLRQLASVTCSASAAGKAAIMGRDVILRSMDIEATA
jgi:hypothetical protein